MSSIEGNLYVCVRDDCSRGYIGSSSQALIEHPHGEASFRRAEVAEPVSVKCRSITQCRSRVELTVPVDPTEPALCAVHAERNR